jgi:mono/diheme cytochrome c family protein
MARVFSFRRRLFSVIFLVPLALVAGCRPDPYPSDMKYPARTDPLVIKPPAEQNIPAPDSFGRLEESIEALGKKDKHGADRGAKLLHVNGQELSDRLALEKKREKPDEREISRLEGLLKELKPRRKQLTEELEKIFGKPARPTVNFPEEAEGLKADLQLETATLMQGSVLFRRHCLHCHGVPGDGRGPTAAWVVPHPRDYRQGLFKFSSVSVGGERRKPARGDLLHTLRNGVEGTSMPSFKLLPDLELEALASYVIHLSLRGQVEFETLQTLLEGNELEKDASEQQSVAAHVASRVVVFGNQWKDATANFIEVAPYEPLSKEKMNESIVRGYIKFKDKTKAGCIECHKDYGRQAGFLYDDWGTMVRPANLTQGVYRGGRRPIDLYYRIHSGITPSRMPAVSDVVINEPRDKGLGVWDVVNFVQALPYPQMIKEADPKMYDDIFGPARRSGAAGAD